MARGLRVMGAVGSITRVFSVAFLLPILVAFVYDAYDLRLGPLMLPTGVLVFGGCALLAFGVGWLMVRAAGREKLEQVRDREAYLTVGLGWLFLCLLAMLPFMLARVLSNPVDAFFETMSGMTTTGATVLGGPYETVPKSLMVWRALLQFVGGMGIIVLSVAVLARFTKGGTALLKAETPGPTVQRLAPRLARTARLLWTVYASIAAVLFLLVVAVLWHHGYGFKQTVYESLILTFTTVSTGGFGAHAQSVAYFHDGLLESVLIVFMVISGMNYTLHFTALRGRIGAYWQDAEWRFFIGTFVVATLITAGVLFRGGQSLASAFGDAAFTVASLITSTGFSTADFDQWPALTKLILLVLMVTGATAGSTGGGIKHVRVLLMLKMIRVQLQRALHPRAVSPVKIGGRLVRESTILTASAFLVSFIGAWVLGTLLLLLFDPAFGNLADATSASVSALSNMGPGFGAVGPTMNYAGLTLFSKILLAFEMWFGRLEIFAAIMVFTPEAWRS